MPYQFSNFAYSSDENSEEQGYLDEKITDSLGRPISGRFRQAKLPPEFLYNKFVPEFLQEQEEDDTVKITEIATIFGRECAARGIFSKKDETPITREQIELLAKQLASAHGLLRVGTSATKAPVTIKKATVKTLGPIPHNTEIELKSKVILQNDIVPRQAAGEESNPAGLQTRYVALRILVTMGPAPIAENKNLTTVEVQLLIRYLSKGGTQSFSKSREFKIQKFTDSRAIDRGSLVGINTSGERSEISPPEGVLVPEHFQGKSLLSSDEAEGLKPEVGTVRKFFRVIGSIFQLARNILIAPFRAHPTKSRIDRLQATLDRANLWLGIPKEGYEVKKWNGLRLFLQETGDSTPIPVPVDRVTKLIAGTAEGGWDALAMWIHNLAQDSPSYEGSQLVTNEDIRASVALLDVWKLGITNYFFDSTAGDRYLKRVTEILSRNTRKDDLLVRYYGGDEFVIVFTPMKVIDLHKKLAKIKSDVAEDPELLEIFQQQKNFLRNRYELVEDVASFEELYELISTNKDLEPYFSQETLQAAQLNWNGFKNNLARDRDEFSKLKPGVTYGATLLWKEDENPIEANGIEFSRASRLRTMEHTVDRANHLMKEMKTTERKACKLNLDKEQMR